MYGPEGTVSFCFPESPDVSRDEVEGNITTGGKTKLTSFPEGACIKCFVIYLDFPLNNHMAKNSKNKQTKRRAGNNCAIVSRPGLTFDFDQGYVTKNQPITEFILLSESLAI